MLRDVPVIGGRMVSPHAAVIRASTDHARIGVPLGLDVVYEIVALDAAAPCDLVANRQRRLLSAYCVRPLVESPDARAIGG